MSYNTYDPLVYKSFGASDPNKLLSTVGSQYGYVGPNTQTDPNYYTPHGPGAGKYVINNQVFNSQNDYNNLLGSLDTRSGFLQSQQQSNPAAYAEFAANPYAFQGNSPFKTAAQKAAEAAAATAAANTAAQGGTAGVGSTALQGTGLTGTPTSLANRTIPAATGLTNIPQNNNALLVELQKLLGKIPGLFDVSGITKGFQNRINTDQAFGNQAATNAGAEFASRTAAEGGDSSLAGLVRAQALLPVLQHSGELQSQLADKTLQAKQGQGQLTATVAEALGNLRTNYLKGLVDYTGKIQDIQSANQQNTQRLNEQGREFDLGHSLDLSKLTLQQKQQSESEKAQRLQALLAMAQLGQSRVNPVQNNNSITSAWPGFQNVSDVTDPFKQQKNTDLDALLRQIQGLT